MKSTSLETNQKFITFFWTFLSSVVDVVSTYCRILLIQRIQKRKSKNLLIRRFWISFVFCSQKLFILNFAVTSLVFFQLTAALNARFSHKNFVTTSPWSANVVELKLELFSFPHSQGITSFLKLLSCRLHVLLRKQDNCSKTIQSIYFSFKTRCVYDFIGDNISSKTSFSFI